MSSTAGGIILSLLLALAVFWIVQRNNYFRLPPPSLLVPVSFLQAFGAFLTYLIFSFVFLPIFVLFLAYFSTGSVANFKTIPHSWLVWIQAIALWILFLLLWAYCFIISPQTRKYIFWGQREASSSRAIKAIGMGVLTCAISYPFVLVVNLLTKLISDQIWGKIEAEQVAVKLLKATLGHPALFVLMVIPVVFLVPFVEELLFRGFFQNLLKRYIGRGWAIFWTACVFSLAHFSVSQGAGNFQLIFSLFVLALFLSFIYERQQTLWASYGLHMTFNGVNVLMILISKG
jgi:membrane protease YdiL (CAAX protease family)